MFHKWILYCSRILKEKQGSKELLEKLEQIAIDEGCAFIFQGSFIGTQVRQERLKAAFKQGFKIKAGTKQLGGGR